MPGNPDTHSEKHHNEREPGNEKRKTSISSLIRRRDKMRLNRVRWQYSWCL